MGCPFSLVYDKEQWKQDQYLTRFFTKLSQIASMPGPQENFIKLDRKINKQLNKCNIFARELDKDNKTLINYYDFIYHKNLTCPMYKGWEKWHIRYGSC